MANTNNLSLENLLRQGVPMMAPALPDLRKFCTILELPPSSPGRTTNIPIVSAVQAVQENPTSFESSTDTLALGQTTPVNLSAQFGLDCATENRGMELSLLLASHLTALQQAIVAKVFALLTAANYGTAVTASAATFGQDDFQALLLAVPSRTAMILDSAWWVLTQATWFPPGSESTLSECSVWTGAEANTHGFVARPEAVALAVGYPQVGPRGETEVRMVPLPIGVSCQLSTWFQRGGRAWRGSADIIIAPEIGQSAALRLLKSA